MNELLLQTFDGLPVAQPNQHARCSECNARIRKGTDVIARFHLNENWRVDEVYCPDCYPDHSHERSPGVAEEAVVEGRLVTRRDTAKQTATPTIRTRGEYHVLSHAEEEGMDE